MNRIGEFSRRFPVACSQNSLHPKKQINLNSEDSAGKNRIKIDLRLEFELQVH